MHRRLSSVEIAAAIRFDVTRKTAALRRPFPKLAQWYITDGFSKKFALVRGSNDISQRSGSHCLCFPR